jgi:hypothetical protein
MDKKTKFYIDMVKYINEIYKKNNKDYKKTIENIYKLDKDNLRDELKNILKYIEKLYISYDKKSKINENIKYGIDISYNYLINIYKKIYKNNNIDIDLLLLIIIPSIIINTKSGYEIIDINIGSKFNNKIIEIVEDKEYINEGCSICFEKNKTYIISNCCCYKTCIKCFNLLYERCAICKGENVIIIRK